MLGFERVIPGLCVAGLTAVAMGAGLDRAEPIGPYLDGALPSLAPTAASGNWELVNAFPNLVVVDPVQMIPVPGAGQLMIAEKWGALVVVADDPETDRRDVILDLSAQVQAEGDSGLLGVAFHPEFGQEGSPNRETLFVYYRYTPEKSELNRAYCRLSRFSWAGGLASIDPASEEVLINQYDRHNWHNGGSLFFGADGFLYFAIGDEGGSNDLFGVAQYRDGGLFSGVFRIDVDRDPARSHPIRRQPVDAEAPPAGWPGSYTQGYFIPDDNPWPSPDGSALEEYWALGLRSPFRMTIDPPTGTIWVGDVGQSQEEELNRVERGANFQWPFREGTAEGAHPRPASFTGVETPPAFRYGRGEGGCVIGGYVYRGTEHPSLVGKYLFGDYNNGRIRSLTETQEGEILVEDLVELGDQQFTSFGVDARGELYLLTIGQTNLNGGIIHRLRRNGTAHPQPPATLSATGAFRDLTTLVPREGVMPYDLIQPLWSDGADKRRWLAIPNDGNPDTEGEQIGFSANGPWDFPVGTVLIKHFEYAGRRLETRFLVRGEDGKFFGFTYQWRADHSDADLLPGPAVVEEIELGAGQSLRWHFPGRFECFECHNEASGLVLGPKTRHLNRDHFYPQTGRTANQLETLASLGFFRTAPSPFAADEFLKAANISDETESLDRRARSYLDINCSHCHLPNGPVQVSFDMRLTTPPHFQNLIGLDPGNDLGLANAKVVKPGAPGESVLLYRMSSTDTCCAMPPIAKNAVDEAAVSVLTRWIASLDPAVSSSGRNDDPVPSDLAAPRIELSLPGGTPVDGAFDVTVSVSEPVFGLTASDFVVTNGQALNLSGSSDTYVLRVQPRLSGPGTVLLPSDRAVDINGHANGPPSEPLSFLYEDPAAPAPGENLLDNGDFESELEGWTRGGDTGTSPLATFGTRAARLTNGAHLVQTVAVRGGAPYRLSVWAQGAGKAVVAFWDEQGRWMKEKVLSLSTGTQSDSQLSHLTAPDDATFATFSLLAADAGTLIIDGAFFAEGGPGDPPPGPLTENADFESGLTHWELEGDVTLSASAHLGSGAARIGANSSATFSRSILSDTRVVMTGAYFTEGDFTGASAGLTFRTADNESISTTLIPLPVSEAYRDFFFFADVPHGASRLSLWVRNEGGGAVTVDDLGLVYVPDTPAPDPRDPETGFEDGLLDPWRTGGKAGLTKVSLSGSKSVALEAGSCLLASRAVFPGTTARFRGLYLTGGARGVREAGLTFRDREGTVVFQSTLVLDQVSAAAPFELAHAAPLGAVSVSAWVFEGKAGTLTLDDLALDLLPDPGDLPAGTQSSTHLHVAGLRTLEGLAERDPSAYSDPTNNLTQPDLMITTASGQLIGSDVYETSARSQVSVAAPRRGRTKVLHEIAWQNDAFLKWDAASFRGSRGNRGYRVGYLALWPEFANVTAAVVSGLHVTAEAAPGDSQPYRIQVRKTKSSGFRRQQTALSARSLLDPGKRDAVRLIWRN